MLGHGSGKTTFNRRMGNPNCPWISRDSQISLHFSNTEYGTSISMNSLILRKFNDHIRPFVKCRLTYLLSYTRCFCKLASSESIGVSTGSVVEHILGFRKSTID